MVGRTYVPTHLEVERIQGKGEIRSGACALSVSPTGEELTIDTLTITLHAEDLRYFLLADKTGMLLADKNGMLICTRPRNTE